MKPLDDILTDIGMIRTGIGNLKIEKLDDDSPIIAIDGTQLRNVYTYLQLTEKKLADYIKALQKIRDGF